MPGPRRPKQRSRESIFYFHHTPRKHFAFSSLGVYTPGMPFPAFPPPYTVRTSARAKRIGLRIRPGLGLEVILPVHAAGAPVDDILERFRPWIERHYPRFCREEEVRTPLLPPEYFFLHGGKKFVVIKKYAPKVGSISKNGIPLGVGDLPKGRGKEEKPGTEYSPELPDITQGNGLQALIEEQARLLLPPFAARSRHPEVASLTLPAAFLDESEAATEDTRGPILHYLREWVRNAAKDYLAPMLEEESKRHGLPYSKLSLRFQKTRWGSCSGKKAISLNACLLFLPEHLTRYIVLHELCHTRVMNHSPAYWRLLFTLDEQALRHDRSMRRAWQYVPGWVME